MHTTEHDRQRAEATLRRELDRTHNVILDYHCGNAVVLGRAQQHGMQLIGAAVKRNEILPPVAESLKKTVQNWWY